MKPTPQNNLTVSGSIGRGPLIAVSAVAAALLIGAYIALLKNAAPSAQAIAKPTTAAHAPGQEPKSPPAQKRTPPPNTPNAKIAKFNGFDLDGDGVCPRTEYERAHWENFEHSDKNKDGMLDRSEFPWGPIVRHDKNKDAKLDREEYKVRYDELFLVEDKNKDGLLFVEEM